MATLKECQRIYDDMNPPSYYAKDEPDWDNMPDWLYNWYLKQEQIN